MESVVVDYRGPDWLKPVAEMFGISSFDRVVSIQVREHEAPSGRDLKYLGHLESLRVGQRQLLPAAD